MRSTSRRRYCFGLVCNFRIRTGVCKLPHLTAHPVSSLTIPSPSTMSQRFKARSLSLSSANGSSKPGRRRDSNVGMVDAKAAVDLATHSYEENVFLFVPNLIGYGRIILAGFALNYMKSHPKVCTALYGLSCLLDAFDGMAARALDQTSKFGAVLDMVTDRYVVF